jgi:hypothetical protein
MLAVPSPQNTLYFCCPCASGGGSTPLTKADGSLADAAAVLGDTTSSQSDGTSLQDAAACYPLFHGCTNNDECCAPNRCLNITGTPACQQEGPQLSGPEAGAEMATTAIDGGSCTWPANVTPVTDASTVGCWAQPSFNICEVPSGGSVNAQDGTILGPDGKPVANACHDVCSTSEYALTCTGATMSPSTIPSPDSSLGCKVIPGPTPSNELSYCCPCR